MIQSRVTSRQLIALALVSGLGLSAAGCVRGGNGASPPMAAATTTEDPVMLTGAPDNFDTSSGSSANLPPVTTANASPPDDDATPAGPNAFVAPEDPDAKTKGLRPGYPNINSAPAEPGGTLLPPAERARIISELEALRDRQAGTPPSLAKKCADPKIAAKDPDCR